MAETCSLSSDTKYGTLLRRELFPSIEEDSDELGLGPLNEPASTARRPLLLKPELKEVGGGVLNKHAIDDLVILENLCNDVLEKSTEKPTLIATPDRLSRGSWAEEFSMSPFYLSPTQSLQSNIGVSPATSLYNTSPSIAFKTPQSTLVTNAEIPKLIRHKSPSGINSTTVELGKRKFPYTASPKSNKHPKLDVSSKVRTVLFPMPDVSVPTSSFYSKTDKMDDKPFKTKTISVKQKAAPFHFCGSKKSKKYYGQINAGVKHKIRKPKKKVSKMLKVAVSRRENSNSPNLNIYNVGNKELDLVSASEGSYKSLNENECDDFETTSDKEDEVSVPDLSKKFFKFKRSSAVVTIDSHLKLKIRSGKVRLVENKLKKVRVSNPKLNFDLADLTVPDHDNLISSQKIDDILCSLDDEEEKENCFKDSEEKISSELVLEAYNSVALSDNSIHLHANYEEQMQNIYHPNHSINSILLSPTSQMCNMTSGLMLDSPKRTENIDLLTPSHNSNAEHDNNITSAVAMDQEKLYPIFYGQSAVPNTDRPKIKQQPAKKFKALPKNQLLLDAGQKRFGATQCGECKMVYHMGDPNDELKHLKYHNAGNVFRFNGWKDERVVARFVNARIIKVLPSDPKSWLKKVNELIEVVNRDLGYFDMSCNLKESQVFFYVKSNTIVGCIIAEVKTTAHKMLSDNCGVDLCSEESYPIKCGISRIWVSLVHRKQGIGTALMNSLRGNFLYGTALSKSDIALSSPTDAGKAFATSYFNTPNFYIYTY